MSTTVGVRALRNSLSRWLRLVQGGESVIVLDRGRPVAVLSAPLHRGVSRSTAGHLASLAARGLILLGTGSRGVRPRRLPRANLSGAVIEDRGDRP